MSESTPRDDAGVEPGTRSAEAAAAETVSELGAGPRKEAVIGRGIAWSATWSARWILIAIALVILGEIVGKAWSILMPVALALLVTAVLSPIAGFFEHRAKFPPALAAAATLLGGVGLVTYGIYLMAPSVANGSTTIADDAIKGIDELQKWVRDSNLFNKEQIDDFLAAAQDRLEKSASVIAGGVLTGVSALTSAVINMVVVAFLVFFFLKDGRHFRPWLRKVAGPGVGAHLMEVSSRAWDTLGGFIRTQAMVSGIDAVLIGSGLLIIGVPLAIPLAVLTFFGGFVPIIGAITAGAIAVLVALVSNGLTGALWVLLLIVVVQQIEGNVLSPMLQSKSMNLHPVVVLLSVTLGSSLFGIAGAFLAVPTTAVAAVFFRYLLEQVDRTVALGGIAPPPRPDEEDEEKHVPLAGVAHKVGSMVTAVRSRRAARRHGSGGGDGA
ncbi:AI-2E family transporter [Nocardioides jishulii]|uniref:AI-2E family transporter n=1 Tax=Nocardioides jishulii TaxID=2575440 RepID=A0A4U2YSZ0_9ACTN|nr:AI-2E family transporter [Nocardioides jishulii]QCX26281.1 AI-2E family transporter [Nocardioides jishulii]TKI63915.1 AI-2E family transporter [Nocardioides jishulii]